jgi:hypothetical protein
VIVPGRGSANRSAAMAGGPVAPPSDSNSVLLQAARVLAAALAAFALLPAVRSVAGLRRAGSDH